MQADPILLYQRFRLEHSAARGGMGVVHRGTDLLTGEAVAVKVVTLAERSQAARFAREACALARLSHPAIVRYVAHGVGPEPSQAFLVMEWIDGPTLRDRLADGPLTIEDAARCTIALARALSAAHTAGLVHRDLKPGNVMLAGGAPERAKLIDFGVARAAEATDEVTLKGAVIGTAGYMAPEQARDSTVLGPPADIYALGCLLFRCLTGRTPFTGDDVLAVLVKLVLEEPPRLADLRPDAPRWLDDLCASLLAREPEYRPASASAVAATLEHHLELRNHPRSRGAAAPLGAEARATITAHERRIGCAVLAAAGADHFAPAFTDEDRAALARAARPFGADVHVLSDGSLLAAIPSEGTAADRATIAARAALALRPWLLGMPLCVLVGEHAAAARVTEAVDRYLPLLRRDTTFAIRLDETAAGLLAARFDLGRDELGSFLRGERDPADVARTLLGKPTPHVGRDRETGLLVSLLGEVKGEGVARVALVTGEAGAGKSRLRHEVLRRAEQEHPGLEVWIGRSEPLAVGSPFALLGQALRRAAGITPLDAPEVARRKLRARVGRRLGGAAGQSATEFLGEVCGLPFDDAASVQLRAARREPALMADQVLRAFEALVRAECEAGPLVIVLEDLHWGDLPSVRLIDAALRHDRPLLVLALARPEVHTRFPDLFHLRGLTLIRLSALSPRSAARLARSILGEAADAALVQRLVEISAGNAFYLEELIRAAASGKTEALPATVLAMAQSVLDTLDPASRRALRACSVFGAAFQAEGLAALLGVPDEDARALLAPLVQSELLTRRELIAGGALEQYTFRHALLREAAYAMLDDDDRALGHRVAARVLSAAGEHDSMLLAEHHERGREPARAVRHYLHAAQQALSGNDLADAILRAQRGVACGAEGAELGALHLVQAEAERWRGRNAEGHAHALAALALLPAASPPWCTAASELASCALKLLLPDTVDELGARLLASVATLPSPPPRALVIACARVAAAALLSGLSNTSRALLEVLSDASIEGAAAAPEALARVQETRAIAALCEGDPCAFLERSEAATAAFLEVGDIRSATIQRANQGHVYGSLGAYEQAEGALREVLAAAPTVASPQLLSAAQQNLGNVLVRLGRTAEARALLEDSLAAALAQGDRRLEVGARVYLSLCATATGDLETALAHVASVTTKGMPSLHVYALGARAHALLAAGRTAEALAAAEQAMSSLATIGGTLEEGEGLVRLAHAEALLASGDGSAAEVALGLARGAIEARAARLTSEALRASFLERVPENARLLALKTPR